MKHLPIASYILSVVFSGLLVVVTPWAAIPAVLFFSMAVLLMLWKPHNETAKKLEEHEQRIRSLETRMSAFIQTRIKA